MTPPAIEAVPALGGGGGGAVTTVAGRTGDVVLTAADVGAGQLPSGVLLPSGIVVPSSADISGILGTSSSKAAAGNDSRLSDTRTPTDGSVTNAKVAGGAAIALSKLATDPLARANHTGTQTMATISDAGALATKSAVASADITDGSIVGGDLNSAIVLPSGATATTQSATDKSAKLATTAQVDAAVNAGLGCCMIGANTYGVPCHPAAAGAAVVNSVSNAARTLRIVVPQTGNLRDLYVFIITQGGNMKLAIYDTGQANADHTVRTQLSASGAIDISAAANSYKGYDPNLAVVKGDTIELVWTADGTTATTAGLSLSNLGQSTLPSNSFFPSSGAGTATSKLVAAPTSFYTTPPSTVTDANWTTASAGKVPAFIFRIS